MHIKSKLFNRIVAMFMCILLLSNLGLSITLASNSDGAKAGYIVFNKSDGKLPEVKVQNNKMSAVYESNSTWSSSQTITFSPTETAIYTVTLSNGEGELEYSLYEAGSKAYTRLAARYGNKNYTILSNGPSDSSTTIDVILEEGKTYQLDMHSTTKEKYVTLALEKRNIQKLAMAGTNIPSNVVSYRAAYKASEKLQEYSDSNIKIIEYENDVIKKYVNDGAKPEEEANNGGTFEGIMTDLIIALGTVFATLIEWAVGANVPLTIDNIIFNRFDQTVLDLNPLGGIQIGSSLPSSGKGIFYNGEIGGVINTLFNALKTLAIAIYIVMLLYIGVKILLSIGGKDQKKYLKYLEYWLTGILLLAILPYFIPAIPATANAIIAMMEEEAKSLNGDYRTSEVLAKLGGDAALLGEDAEVVELHNLIDEKINKLNEQINGTPGTKEEAQANIDANIQAALNKFHGDLTDEELNELSQKIQNVKSIIDVNYANWTPQIQSDYEAAIQEVKDFIFDSVETTQIVSDIIQQLPTKSRTDMAVYRRITNIINYVKNNASKWNSSSSYQNAYNSSLAALKNVMSSKRISDEFEACKVIIDQVKQEYISYATSDAFTNLEALFENYKNAVIQEEIEDLKDMKNKISNDVMTVLKSKAQSENRIVYAIAWIILLYQMIAILMMYYKRVLVTVILVIIFPIVMAFYVIDKSGDGKSQSLSNWLREFLAVILVQVLHAGIYVILVNVGIDACNANPDQNWFFLILTVCFLFPGERILRSILGLNSSVIDGLRNNIAGTIAGGIAIKQLTRNTYRAAKSGYKNLKNGGLPKKWQDEFKKEEKKLEDKKKRKNDLERSKENARKYREEYRRERQDSISKGTASKWDKVHESASKAKDAVTGLGVVQAGKTALSAGKTMVSKVKNNKVIKGTAKAARIGKFALKKGMGVAKKGVGLTMGAMEGMENFSQGGAMSGLYTARRVAKAYGGFKDQKAIPKEYKAPSRFQTVYDNGNRVAGSGRQSVAGNINIAGANRAAVNTTARANRIREQLNVNTTTQANQNGNPNGNNNP